MESKLEAEREQWNMHHYWGILLLYWELREGWMVRKSFSEENLVPYTSRCGRRVCSEGSWLLDAHQQGMTVTITCTLLDFKSSFRK